MPISEEQRARLQHHLNKFLVEEAKHGNYSDATLRDLIV